VQSQSAPQWAYASVQVCWLLRFAARAMVEVWLVSPKELDLEESALRNRHNLESLSMVAMKCNAMQ